MRSILAVTSLSLPLFFGGQAVAEQPNGVITVSGQGQVAVVPDMATINLGVLSDSDTAKDAMAGMSEKIRAILARLEESGIDSLDVQTSSLRLNPIQDYNNSTNRARITGYTAQSTVTVRVRDLAALGVILDQALSDGANQLNGLQFDVADRSTHLDAARALAVADAMSKAGVFVTAAGAELGALIAISESGAQPSPMMMEMSMSRDAGVPVAAGDISISASVSMTYAIDSAD